MGKKSSPRKGSLQYWPRKRADKFLPSVNWDAIDSDSIKGLKGFLCYKAGMASAIVKDNTPDSMTKGKKIAFPVTILECPTMKIFSVRFYKYGRVAEEILNDNLDKELKRQLKLPKNKTKKLVDELNSNHEKLKNYEDVRVIVYSQAKKTGIGRKAPDLSEIGLTGKSIEEKINFVKEHVNKEISINDLLEKGKLVDLRGLTKGKGLVGPVKRFGITLKQHKSEKGRRRPGSLGPWHPAHTTFLAPQAGQLGMFTRAVYNNKVIVVGKVSDNLNIDKLKNIKNYGDIKTDFVLVRGSVQGPAKRQLIITNPLRITRKQLKKTYDFIELR